MEVRLRGWAVLSSEPEVMMDPSGGTRVIEVVLASGLGVIGAVLVTAVSLERRAVALVRQPVRAATRRLRSGR